MQRGGGWLTAADLASYRARAMPAIHLSYRGYDIYAPPLPSSGGIVLGEMLNVLECFDLARLGRWSTEAKASDPRGDATRLSRSGGLSGRCRLRAAPRASADQGLCPAAGRVDRPSPCHAEAQLAGDEIPLAAESPHTTHFSIVDEQGMAVANTYTLEQEFGSRIVVRGAGFLLNNEMGDFNWGPGLTDRQGHIGTAANQIAPGKRMLSSATPTVVARDGRLVLVTGSPGGRSIINTVLEVVLNVCEFHLEPVAAIDAPRMHQPWLPDRVEFEGTDDPRYRDLVAGLRALGHTGRAANCRWGMPIRSSCAMGSCSACPTAGSVDTPPGTELRGYPRRPA